MEDFRLFIDDMPPDFSLRAVLGSHGWGSLAPFMVDRAAGWLERVEALRNGRIVRWRVMDDAPGRLTITVDDALDTDESAEVIGIVRRVLSVDQRMDDFYAALRPYPDYAWIERAHAGRMLISPTVWEDLAKTLLTTNTTWAMTINMVKRLNDLGNRHADDTATFPTPAQIAAMPFEAFHAHIRAGYRGAYLYALAHAITDGTLEPERWRDPALPSAEVYRALKGIKGFGDYAAGAMLRLLERADQLGLDSVCRAMYARHFNGGAPANDREIAAYYARFGAWGGLAVWMDVMREWLD